MELLPASMFEDSSPTECLQPAPKMILAGLPAKVNERANIWLLLL